MDQWLKTGSVRKRKLTETPNEVPCTSSDTDWTNNTTPQQVQEPVPEQVSKQTAVSSYSSSEGIITKKRRYLDSYINYGVSCTGEEDCPKPLCVVYAPAMPTNVRVLERTSRRVTIAWTPAQDGNSPITRYIIRYNPMQDSWQGPSEEITAEGSQSNVILTPLRPYTLYSVRVVAENTLGPGAASQELRVRTDEEAPSAPPLHIMVEATSSTQLVLTWEPPPEDQWNGPLLGHYVGHRELGDSESKRQYNFTTVAWRGNGKEEWHLNGLKKFYKYGLVVQAFNSKGPGPLAMQVVAQTLEDVPDSSPRDVRCAPLSPESLQVSWQPPPETLVHGVIQGYRLLYEPVPATEQHDIAEPRTKMTTALKTVLHGLLKFTNYSIELLAFTRVGDGVKSTQSYCQTKEDVPGPPAGIKAVLQDPETALVTWLTPTHPNGVILRYSVHIRVVDGGRQVDVRSISHHSPSHLQYQLPGLKKRLFYEFWVTAFTKVGEGQSSPVVSLTPSSKVKASIVSFGGAQLAAWKSDVRLPCRAVGIQELKRQWLVGDSPLNQQPRLNIAPDGSLLLSTVQRSDQGEYTCVVWNEYGKDVITYHLRVQDQSMQDKKRGGEEEDGSRLIHMFLGGSSLFESLVGVAVDEAGTIPGSMGLAQSAGLVDRIPPGTPLLLMTESTQHTLQLQWKLGDDGGSPIRGFVLHYKLEHGEWEEARLDGTRSTHVLANLRCGTLYHVYVTAYNRVGSGSPSKTLDVRTRGGLPLLPAPADLLLLNSSSVALRLSIWPDGGCPMLYYVVEYAPRLMEVDNWLVGTVSPSHVVTQNDGRAPLHKDVKIVLLCLLSSLIIALGFLGICFCVKKKSREPSPHQSLEDVQANANQDNKHNLARREQYYATVRKLPPSPGTLECIPEYSEDIRPYATFHVPGPQSSESTKLQTFVYRESDASPTVKSVKSEYCRVKKSHQCDEYDSFGSESDTEPGTSSRTESSNQLDDGGHHGDMSRSYHPPVSRLAKPLVNSIYPGPEWSPPAVDPLSSVERRPFQRRYCQTHLPK
uniref:Down syndrome cell adhesion molecule-like protein Dscam2 n=1 Tax=Timema monikensis TaxID=170555 RepID=A0A7R9E2K2_9NEOP|nr:unnamed protein product [Timema monikensis]